MTVGYPHSKLVARLRGIASLTDQDAALIEALPLKLQSVPAGTTVIEDGQSPDQCCLLVDGYLVRWKGAADGERQIFSWHVPGDMPDLYSLHLIPADHSLTAVGAAVVAYVSHRDLRDVLERSSSLTRILWRETLVDSAVFREWVINLGKRGALSRIAHIVCEMHARLAVVGLVHQDRFVFPVSQVDMADAAGMTAVHANRMIQQLRSQGLIEWQGPSIRILDLDKLQQVADFDAAYLHLRRPG
jgi:CRP-like cAMP-binding protein